MKTLRALGLMSGIGSMLCAARQVGYKIIGNTDHRSCMWTGTFQYNFPEAWFEKTLNKKVDGKGLVVFCHPSCGAHSSLNLTGKNKGSVGDIPLLISQLQEIDPDYFVVENLQKMLEAVSSKVWEKAFPKYDLYFIAVENYKFGNPQLKRTRLFIVASKKKKHFIPVLDCKTKERSVKDVIGDIQNLYGKIKNHHVHAVDVICKRATHLRKRNDRPSWRVVRDYFKDKRCGQVITYFNSDIEKTMNQRPGFKKIFWTKHSHVLSGGGYLLNPKTCLPLSIRERARLMGFPDDFYFVGEKLEKDKTWVVDKNSNLVKQTAKAVPLEAVRFFAKQILEHEKRRKFK